MKALRSTNVLRKKRFAVKEVYVKKQYGLLGVQELIFALGGWVFQQVLVDLGKRIDLE